MKDERGDEGVRAATEQFYTALNAMFTGDLQPMDAVWSHADDVAYMGPDGGFRIGWAAVRAEWETQAALKLGGQVTPAGMKITAGRDLAVAQSHVRGANADAQGNPVAVSIRATVLLRAENGAWKVIGVHTDPLSLPER